MNVYAFRYWLPHTFFVRRCEVADGITTLNHMAAMSFEPRDVAYIPENLNTSIVPPHEGAQVILTTMRSQDFRNPATAHGNNLLFLSDAYYPKGWKAFLDGKEIEIVKLDYMFCGVIISKGVHTLVMKFEPLYFILCKGISLAANALVWGTLLAGTVHFTRQRRKLKSHSENKQ